jgi:hypothetical protein
VGTGESVGEKLGGRVGGRVGNFRQKNNSAEDGIDGKRVISDGIPAVPRNRMSRNSVPNPAAGEKTTRNSVPWNKNRIIFSEFPSEVRKSRLSSTPLQVLEKRRHKLMEKLKRSFQVI